MLWKDLFHCGALYCARKGIEAWLPERAVSVTVRASARCSSHICSCLRLAAKGTMFAGMELKDLWTMEPLGEENL